MTPDLIGKQFGNLIVLARKANRIRSSGSQYSQWLCRCECGKEKTIEGRNLRTGHTKSCGCRQRNHALKSGERAARWICGKTIDNNGYVRISSGVNKNRLEHRAVMEIILGRPLILKETVHHKNGIRTDNRPENLELRAENHGRGSSIPDLINWAIEVLNRYAPERLKCP